MIIKILSSKDDLRAEILELQQLAQSEGGFETVRELDLHYAVARKDQALFQKVYQGTRFPSYRKNIKQKYGEIAGSQFSRKILFSTEDDPSVAEDFNSESLDLSASSLQMLKILLSDFYRPIQLGEVFRDLYPMEYFNPNSSKDRLYKVFSRLKHELQLQSAPLEISWRGSQISWGKTKNFQLVTHTSTRSKEALSVENEELGSRFSIHDFIKSQGKSRRTCERQLDKLVKEGIVKRLRPGLFEKKAA
jgi:hypothetical protein